ncbi:MAG: hypothetical protein QOI83_2110, partial [Streptomycetaceae bacterium]|nr:hypothetical protein [Streptomycetaceae bacterium]
MGILDRLRGRTSAGATGTATGTEPDGTVSASGTAPDTVSASAAASGRGGRRGWSGLPPIQRATAEPSRHAVASADFASSLASWQNPSFTGSLSHAVLDGAPTGLIRDALTPASAGATGPSGRLGEPALSLPLAVAETDDAAGPSVQRVVSAARATGPQIAPVRSRSARPVPLTRAPAPPSVQRRVLPA